MKYKEVTMNAKKDLSIIANNDSREVVKGNKTMQVENGSVFIAAYEASALVHAEDGMLAKVADAWLSMGPTGISIQGHTIAINSSSEQIKHNSAVAVQEKKAAKQQQIIEEQLFSNNLSLLSI